MKFAHHLCIGVTALIAGCAISKDIYSPTIFIGVCSDENQIIKSNIV